MIQSIDPSIDWSIDPLLPIGWDTEPTTSAGPRLSTVDSIANLKRHKDRAVALHCQAQGYPPPVFRFFSVCFN